MKVGGYSGGYSGRLVAPKSPNSPISIFLNSASNNRYHYEAPENH